MEIKLKGYQFCIILFEFLFTLITLIVINNCDYDDTLYHQMLTAQVLGIVTIITSVNFNKNKENK